jgi:hypothetical protein
LADEHARELSAVRLRRRQILAMTTAEGRGAFRRQAAWYRNRHPRPSPIDALALVRKELWVQEERTFYGSPAESDTIKVPRAFVERLTDAVCYAA